MHAPQKAGAPIGSPPLVSSGKNSSNDSRKRIQFAPPASINSSESKRAKKAEEVDAESAEDLQNQVNKVQTLFHQATPHPNVTFIVQGKRFEAHRKVLSSSACSTFFLPILKQDSPIEIKGLSAEVFQALLDHIYIGDLSLNPKTFLELYQFYSVQKFTPLMQELEALLIKTVDWRMLSTILLLAYQAIPGSTLFQSLMNLGLRHSAYLWIGLDRFPLPLFLEILKQDGLAIESEHHLVKLISCWSKLHAVQDPKEMDACFEHVRFGLMSENELTHLQEAEKLVSPKMWRSIHAKLSKKEAKANFWKPRLEAVPDLQRFAFAAEPAEMRNKENKRAAFAHGFVFKPDEREKKLFLSLQGSLCEFSFRWDEQETQCYPFKLYLAKGGEQLNSKKVYIWLQTQVRPNAPSLMVCELQHLRKGLSFTSRYLATLKSRLEKAEIRFSAVFLL